MEELEKENKELIGKIKDLESEIERLEEIENDFNSLCLKVKDFLHDAKYYI